MLQLLLPYNETDDDAALRYVNFAVREPRRANWKGLVSDARVVQTYRALRRLQSDSEAEHVRRYDHIRHADAQRTAGVIGDAEFAQQYKVYAEWRRRAATFDGVLRQYLDMTTDHVRVVRRDLTEEQLRASLLTLALAVDDHRATHAGEESLADTALWARLHTLPWPIDTNTQVGTLADAVAAERTRRRPARAHGEGFLRFEGQHVQGIVVDVADLLLEVTDHTTPSISRPTLIELWKQRTPDLNDADAATVMRQQRAGSYATRRLRMALLLLENLGTIARITDDSGQRVKVTNRHKLSELRRRWNEKHFGNYALNL